MIALNENFVVDHEGHKTGVFIDFKTYEHLVEELEELDDIRVFDQAQADKKDAIPFRQAISEIEQVRAA